MVKILKVNIPKDPEMFLLGLNMERMRASDRTLIWYMITAARLLYAQNWKLQRIPEVEEWIFKLIQMAEMDKLTKKWKDMDETLFLQEWKKFKDYLEKDWDVKGDLYTLENY